MAPLPAPGANVPGTVNPNIGKGLSGQITNAPTNCLLSLPSVSLPVVGSIAGGTCLFTKTQARAIISALLIGAGGFAALVGAVLLGAGAVNTPAGRKAAGGLIEGTALVTGQPEVAAAGRSVRRSGVAGGARASQAASGRERQRVTSARRTAERRARAQDRNDERTERAAARPQRSTPETTRRRELERVPF